MKNDFSPEDKRLFTDNFECWNCGKNGWDAFHHIVGRGGPAGQCEGSIYNAAPMHNFQCHIDIHGMLMKDFSKMKLLLQTKKYLDSIGYKPKKKDILFLEKYKRLYGKL